MSDKVQKALEARKKKKQNSTDTSNDKIANALKAREKYISSNLDSVQKDISTRYDAVMNEYNTNVAGTSKIYGDSANELYNNQRKNSLEVSNLMKDVEAYRKYFDADAVDGLLASLEQMDSGYKGLLSKALYKTEDEYDTAIRLGGYYTKYQGMTPEDEAKALEDLNLRYAAASTAGSEEANLLQEEIDFLYNYGSKETQIAGRKKQYANNSAKIENLNAEMKPLEEQAIALFNEIEHTLDLDKVAELQKQRNDILASYNELKAQRDTLVAENNIYDRTEKVANNAYLDYTELSASPDFNEYIKKGKNLDNGVRYIASDSIIQTNPNRVAAETGTTEGITEEQRLANYANKLYMNMTEEEVALYNYYLGKEGEKRANAFLKELKPELERRKNFSKEEMLDFHMNKEGWEGAATTAIFNVASVVAKPYVDTMAFVDNSITQAFNKGEVNPYSQWQSGQNTVNYIREATTQAIEANTKGKLFGKNVWGQIYNAGMSTLDSLYGATLFGKWYTVIAASGAASTKAKELYKKGATGDQIFLGGTAAGLAEAAFEYISIDNLIKAKNPDKWYKILWEGFKQAGIEGSEELATEIANNLSDDIIMGSQSDFNLAIKKYMDENPNASYDEAYAEAKKNKLNDIIWAGISGMLSGGVSGGIKTTFQGAKNYFAGKDIKKQGDTEAMIMAGVDAQQGSQAYKLAEKAFRDYTEGDALYRFAEKVAGADSKFTKWVAKGHGKGNVSSMRLGALKQTTMEDVVDQYRNRETLSESDIQAKLESRGIDSKKAAEFASVVAKVANGKKLSERESAILNDNIDVKDVAEEVSSGQVVDNIAANIKLNKIGSLGKEKVAETPDTYSVSEADGKTLLKDSGAEVNIVDIASIDNGNMMLKVNDGTEVKEVNAENISFASNEEAVMYEMVAGMDIDAASAKAIIGNFDAKSGITAGQYILGAQEAFTYGKYNFAPEEMSKIGFSADLTQAQKTFAYNLGKNMHITNVAAQESAVKKAVDEAKTDNKVQGGKKGNVIYESGETALTDRQEASVKSLEVIAKALGIDIYLYESTLDDKGRRAYIDKDGKRITANGYYDSKTGDIHIDINAGENGEGVMLFTAAHELTHFVRQWSPAKFKVLADFLMAEYGKAGVPVAELVRYQQNLASKQGRKISYDTAYEEMIADSMQTMLSDGAVVEKLAKLANKDKSLVEKMKEKLDELVKAIKGEYAKMTPYSKAGRYAAMLKEGERLQELFYDALVSAGDNYRGAGGKMNIADAEMKLMARELGNDLGTIERTDNGDIALITNKDKSLVLYSPRTYEEGGREKLEATLKANGHTQEEINDTLKLMDDAADYLRILAAGYAKKNYGKFGERLSEHLEATVTTDLKGHKQVLSTLVNNGDYPVNLDLALICKKRVAYMRLMTRLIEDGVFGDVVYGGDAIAEVNAILREDGFETACLGCFVESRRLQFQTWAETIVQEWNEAVDAHTKNAGYFGFAKGGKGNLTEDDMDAMEAELKGQKKNDKGNVNLGQGSAVTRMNRLLDKMPSLAKKLTVDDLLTPQGLTTLRQADGNLFSIVKSRYGAASPKIVQEFSPYASEIANLTFSYVKKMTGESISGGQGYIRDAQKELAAEKPVKVKGESKEDFKARKKVWDDKVETLAMNNYLFAIGGARIQSFSDFMIENVFDYIQIMADLAAKGSPLHGYTKEIACLRLFGMTGAKWNGSLIAHVDRSMGKEMAGLLPASEAKNGNAILVHTPKGDFAIGFDDYARHMATNKKSFIQSIGMKDIVALMLDPRYSANVGNITIGVSDMQILGMLDSPLFRMVIPYHASGMLPQFAQLVGVDFYNDYTNYQNTTVNQYFDIEGNPISELKNAKGDTLKPDMSYKYNEEVQKLSKKGVKDAPRQAANNYIEWCAEQHEVWDGKTLVGYATLKPKFSDSPYGTDFSKHKNYYKLLEDFNMYDNNTEAVALQEAVKMVLPSEANRLNAEQMEAYKQALRDTGIFTEADITKYAKKADMTFEEIIKAECDNRQAYEEETDPKWDTTVKKVEDHLKKHHPRDGQAKSAEDYANAKGDKAISRIKAVDGSYAIQLADNDIRYSERDFPIDTDVEKTVNNAFAKKTDSMNVLSDITSEQNKAINRLVLRENNDAYRGKYEGGKHRFSDNAIRHIISEHGDFLREGLRAQLPMTRTDIARHLSAIKDDKSPTTIKATRTAQGNPSIVTSYEVNGYTLYAEEIKKSLGENLPSDLIGHTMYKAPTLSTAAFYTTSVQTQPKRQSIVLCEYSIPNNPNLSTGSFVSDKNGDPAQLNYISLNGQAKHDVRSAGLIALSSDSANFTDKSGKVEQGYVRCEKPFYITQDNRVFDNSKTNVSAKIEALKKQGYDCFIFDKTVGDNYMVAVINKAQIIKDAPTPLYSERDNIGYHAGDLGKAEYYHQQGYGRDTGHFGTGTYFVGDEERINGDSTYGKRPHHAVDFTDYNLYKIKNDKDGYDLHDQLRVLDGGFSQEFYDRAVADEFRFYPYISKFDLAEKKYKTESNSWDEAYTPAMQEIADMRGIEYQSLEEWSKENNVPADDEYAVYYYNDYLEETISKATEKVESDYAKFREAYFYLWLRFGESKTRQALQKTINYQREMNPDGERNYWAEHDKKADSLATVFMKALGYEGIDVRGTKLDNTAYGSVIYDIKEDTVLYSERDSTIEEKVSRELPILKVKDFTFKMRRTGSQIRGRENEVVYDVYYGEKRVGDSFYSKKSAEQFVSDKVRKYNEIAKANNRIFAEKNKLLYSERNPDSFSNRSLLANALENAATNDIEKNKLKQYKEKIDFINAEERKLADLNRQLKELRFSKGKRDAAKAKKIRDLQDEATKTANRISIYDKQLLNLEASKPLKNILEREKAKAAKRQKQRDAEILQEQKDKANTTIREIMNRNTESRKKAVEGRHKTVVRNKIKRAIKDLNSVFNRGTKERNVKIGLRETVRKALEASEVLFSDEITNEDIVRLGVDSVSEQDKEKLERYATLLALRDTKTDALEISRINSQISKLNRDLKDVFIRERARLNRENVSSALDSLAEAYASLQNSDDDYIKNNAFVQGMHDRIKSLSENLNGVTIKDMSLEQLEEVYKMYSSVKHMIVNANSIFRDGLREDLSKKIMTVQGEILELQKDNRKDPRVIVDAIGNAIKSFDWNNQKPVYAFEKLGSQAFQELFWDAVKAEGVYAQDVVEAGEFLDEQKDKFKYADWDFKKAKTFKSANGLDFKLTLSDMMSIYAYSKRPQAFDHMTQGGFTFDRGSEYVDEKGRKRKHVRLSETYTVSIELINEIVKTLSEEQIGYVDAVQAYLTSLGEKGNEISRTLYGIDLFTEKVYFPLKSDADYRSSVEQALNETQTQVSLKNTGMTKQTVPHANNPIVLQGFDDVVLGHIDNMSKYHSFVLPIENLRRVFDNVSRDENASYDATKVIIESVFGESAKQYFDQYITDLNGGVHIGGYQNFMMDMFSKMKKTAVSASLSVVVQQPFAVIRAMDQINPMYFAPVNFNAAKKTDAKSQWEELKKYAPVAIIKEMGGFDVGSSRTTRDYIGGANYKGWGKVKGFFKDSDYRSQSLDNIFMWGASKADELGWSTIWKAVKKEVASQHMELAVGSEEFLQKCGERFTEVIVYTQVYDSVNSRSGMMRSKRDLDKFATSFMGEPTTTINMVENRMLKLARAVKSKKGVAKASAAMGRTIGVTLGSILLTSLAKSLVYAGRDDDEEDKALLERWAKSFGDSLTNDLNPLTMIPYLRDFVSIWEGWDVERPDMTVVADIVTSIKKAIDEGCDLEEAIALIGNAGNALGLPVKNIIREVQGAINVFNDITDDIEPTDISGAFKEGWTGEDKSKKDSLYQALANGDESRVAIIKAKYKTEEAYESAFKSAIRENNPTLKQAVIDMFNGKFTNKESAVSKLATEFDIDTKLASDIINSEYSYFTNKLEKAAEAMASGDKKAHDDIVRELRERYRGIYSQDEIIKAIKEVDLEKDKDTEDDKDEESSVYNAWMIKEAFDNGDNDTAYEMINDIVAVKTENYINDGYKKKEAESKAKSSVKSSITSYWKPIFLEAYNNKDSAEQKRIRQILLSSGLYGRTSEVIDTTQQWIKDSKKNK